ncbi:FxDxF family PEP-CTERM protein [Nitrosomonas sp.]|uniref:FxDxF family PEP-CTERM protein n=1 Tax=Nitrosomonas sp. TaxID=42353 RepID=UPI0025DB48BC|nr:FxDxF family PEP-CTERM protein [Nitrosomonas sp.]
MKRLLPLALGSLITAFASTSAFAITVSWTDWTSSTDSFSASGSLAVGSDIVDVGYSATGAHAFVTTGSGTNYWTGSAYTNGTVDNAPPASDIIALNQGGTVTITFSQTVVDPYIGLVSWNGNTVDFGVPIVVDSFGSGYWGSGTPILNPGGTGFFGSGEVHGVIRLPGSFDSITFTHTSENWHGFTVGVAGIAPVPEPETYAMLLAGLGLLGFMARRRQHAA